MNYLIAVDSCFPEQPGGMARVAWDLARVMHDRGHHATMVCIGRTRADEDCTITTQSGIRVLTVRKPNLPAWHPLRLQRGIAAIEASVRRLLADEHWDLVHVHSLQTGTGVLEGLGRRHHCVCTVHSPAVLEQRANALDQGALTTVKTMLGSGLLRRLEGRLLAASSAVHVLSDFTRRELARIHGTDLRMDVIPHWRRPDLVRTLSREEARRRLGWPPDEKILFTVRHHGPRNGIELAIRAVAPLAASRSCRFYIAGDGPLRQAHQRLVVELGAADRITLAGRISEADLALAYQAADAFLLPTRALECFGLIIIEALAYGCPVLASDAGAIPEILQPILPDCIFPAGDVHAMRDTVGRFLRGELAIPPAPVLTAYVERRFGADVLIPRYLDLLEPEPAHPSATLQPSPCSSAWQPATN